MTGTGIVGIPLKEEVNGAYATHIKMTSVNGGIAVSNTVARSAISGDMGHNSVGRRNALQKNRGEPIHRGDNGKVPQGVLIRRQTLEPELTVNKRVKIIV